MRVELGLKFMVPWQAPASKSNPRQTLSAAVPSSFCRMNWFTSQDRAQENADLSFCTTGDGSRGGRRCGCTDRHSSSLPVGGIGFFFLGFFLLGLYGTSLNLAPVEFATVTALYVAVLFIVFQIVNVLFFRTLRLQTFCWEAPSS